MRVGSLAGQLSVSCPSERVERFAEAKMTAVSGKAALQCDLLTWLNVSLQTEFSAVEEIRSGSTRRSSLLSPALLFDSTRLVPPPTGACFCQLMDWLFPGCLNLRSVNFQAQDESEFVKNYSILEASFRKKGVTKTVPVPKLVRGKRRVIFNFLRWFKKFFDANFSGQSYEAMDAREGQAIVPVKTALGTSQKTNPGNEPEPLGKTRFPPSLRTHAEASLCSDYKCTWALSVNVVAHTAVCCRQTAKMYICCFWPVTRVKTEPESEEANENTPKKRIVFRSQWQKTFNWVRPSKLGDVYAYCQTCDLNLNITEMGKGDLRRHEQTQKHQKSVKSSCEGRLCSTGVLRFIKKHWAGWEAAKTGSDGDRVPSHPERHVLGLGHLQGLASICTKTPYCVYLYCRVDLGGAKSADVILLGFFDVDAGKHLIRLLDVVQPEEDAAHTANSLIKTLKTSKIPTVKLAAFHVAGEDEFAEQVASHLKGLLPHAVSLVGLYSLSDRACRTIIETHSSLVKELVMELYHHYSSCSSTDDNLKELFGSVGVRPPVLSHCLVFCQIVCKILGMWSDLATYFKSCDPTDDRTKKISAHLENLHMKATVMFLSHALQPLCDFQEQLEKREGRREDLVHVLLEASDLLRSYAASFLHSSAAIKFLKERDISVLKSKKSHLPDAEVNVGVAVEDFLEEHKEALADMLPTFAEGAISFYVSVTAAVAESLPLNEGSLRNVSKLLSPSRVLKLTGKALLELGAEFCLRDIKRNATQLTNDLVHYQLELGKESSQDFQELVPCLEQHWSAALKAMPPTSILRTLVLTLLALPCPPLKAEKVFAQALEIRDAHRPAEIRSEGESDVSRELDLCDGEAPAENKQPSLSEKGHPEMSGGPCSLEINPKEPVICIDDEVIWTGSYQQGARRGIHGWESSLRQRPQARTVFQAAAGVWEEPRALSGQSRCPRKADKCPVVVCTAAPAPSQGERGVTFFQPASEFPSRQEVLVFKVF
ncbi:hypothetical protein Z043_116948 [Scleropages formosus]|uniref:Uncharacterized protein n=1 Tax=Scleropages formosus TaxID=113540 RepID=A0A0P7UX64_SCLFO|nr:hypothetical protein Z043_116948 [Scleropages formosus]